MSERTGSAVEAVVHPRAAYIHVPFCRSKCFYCDFNSYAGLESELGNYTEALTVEMESAPKFGVPLSSVYFGGGTPTLLPTADLAWLLGAIRENFGLDEGAEITIEANPGTVEPASLETLRKAGFNRLSIGIQSFNDETLAHLGRIHTSAEAADVFLAVRRAGFDNISIDLMYALPDQPLEDWERTLARAIELAPEHISLYELTVEEGTVFGNLRARCELQLPDEDLQIDMYEAAIARLGAAGYEHYEISNFARPTRRSRHNQVYWRNEAYYGFGAGATGCLEGVRTSNIASPSDYIESVMSAGAAVETTESVTGRQSMGETVMLGIRMLDGLDLDLFQARFGTSLRKIYAEELAYLKSRELIEITADRLKLTPDGLWVANEVAAEFL